MDDFCRHTSTRIVRERCYAGPVASKPGFENPAAHGNIEIVEECKKCGAQRAVLINGRHEETGPWGSVLVG